MAKKITKKTKEKVASPKNDNKMTRQLIYVLIGMAVLLIVIFVVPFIRNYGTQFSYLGLNWDKEKFGQITVYHTTLEFRV